MLWCIIVVRRLRKSRLLKWVVFPIDWAHLPWVVQLMSGTRKSIPWEGEVAGLLCVIHTLLPYQGSGNYRPPAKYGPLHFDKLSFRGTQLPLCVYYCLWLLSCYHGRLDNCRRDNMAGKMENIDYLALYSKSLPSDCSRLFGRCSH